MIFVSCNLQCHLSMIWTSGIKLSDCRNKFCVLLFTHKLMPPPPPQKKEDLLRLHEKILIFLIYVKSQWKRISKKFYVVNKINNNKKSAYRISLDDYSIGKKTHLSIMYVRMNTNLFNAYGCFFFPRIEIVSRTTRVTFVYIFVQNCWTYDEQAFCRHLLG